MQHHTLALTLALSILAGAALAEAVPGSAHKATMEEFKMLADGKTVDVVIYDAGIPVTATLIWNWKKKQITGNALLNNKDKIKVKTKLFFKDDKACADQEGKPVCHAIFIEEGKFYEVRDDGQLHATSTLKQ